MPPPGKSAAARNPWILGFAAFFNDLASETLLRLLPVFLTETLGAKYSVIGLMDGVAEASAAFFRPIAGALSDWQKKRRGWVAGGYFISTLARLALLVVNSWPLAVAIRFTDRLGKGIRNGPKDALIAASRPAHGRGHAFGIDRTLDFAGAVLGLSLAAWYLHGTGGHLSISQFHWIAAAAVLPGLLAGVLPFFAREVPWPEKPAGARTDGKWLTRPLLIFYALSALFALANSSDSFLLLAARQRGFSLATALLLFAGFNAIVVIASIPLSRLSDRIGRRRLIFAGWLIYAACYALMALAPSRGGFVAGLLGYGLYFACTEGAARALVGDLTPPACRARAYGWFFAIQGLMMLLGNLGFGMIVDYYGGAAGFRIALLIDAGLATLAGALLLIWGRNHLLPKSEPT